MPTYDYVCKACGASLEIFQSMKESAKRKCPSCGKLALERQIGAGAGFIFKGSGFYETDYRSDSYKQGEKSEKDSSTAKKDAPAKADSGSGSKKKSEAKKKPSKD
ncbi:Zinc ribbon domain protein [Planctomycetes bacterium Pla163]|uniref:Zinc ribbon domain protein n=1 Tax=Rohdeia mirabilis TaxID=2528008 RepID=A0A518CZP2_9BACT|nr:Zinc ribbon domain protein [Planctomycetes bacterium Pla163]